MKRFIAFLSLIFIPRLSIADNMTCGALQYVANYEPYHYTCTAGQFLPANTLGCVSCPAGATCAGGTFDFNENTSSGLFLTNFTGPMNNACATNFPTRMNAIYEINQYTCAAGTYLPAGNNWVTDTDGCTTCPENSYCPGGTYTFNETTAQGITSCATGLYSPVGMWESAQCGRILHIGDEVVYLRASKITDHALHVDVDHDGVADYFGNMTTADVVMHAGSERKLKVKLDGVTYSIYDDTVTVP